MFIESVEMLAHTSSCLFYKDNVKSLSACIPAALLHDKSLGGEQVATELATASANNCISSSSHLRLSRKVNK